MPPIIVLSTSVTLTSHCAEVFSPSDNVSLHPNSIFFPIRLSSRSTPFVHFSSV